MSRRRRSKVRSNTPEIDYIVNGLDVLGRALGQLVTGIVKIGCSVVCCTVRELSSLRSRDRNQ